MKIKTMHRSLEDHLPTSSSSTAPVSRNLDPALHPFARSREYTRAVTAAKLERMFAKPFVASLEGHGDGIYCMTKDELEDEEYEEEERKLEETKSRGSPRVLTCGSDKTVKLWDLRGASGKAARPLQTFNGKSGFNSISHHRYDPIFATASHEIEIWDETKTAPLSTLKFHSTSNSGVGEHIVSVAFNKSETSVLASSGSDRTVCLYDLRSGKALGRVAMQMRVNHLVFNPLQPPILLCASEDHNLYTFDMRNLSSTTQVYKGHVGAVMGCDWSPTGREFVSGSYDRTVRLWKNGEGASRDTYHTKRMQRVFSTLYTLDARFVLTGSDDANLRIWKARASEKLGVVDKREQVRKEYRDGLREKWGTVADVAKVERTRYLPKPIHQATKLKREMVDARRTKQDNRIRHAPKGINQEELRPAPAKKAAIQRVEQ